MTHPNAHANVVDRGGRARSGDRAGALPRRRQDGGRRRGGDRRRRRPDREEPDLRRRRRGRAGLRQRRQPARRGQAGAAAGGRRAAASTPTRCGRRPATRSAASRRSATPRSCACSSTPTCSRTTRCGRRPARGTTCSPSPRRPRDASAAARSPTSSATHQLGGNRLRAGIVPDAGTVPAQERIPPRWWDASLDVDAAGSRPGAVGDPERMPLASQWRVSIGSITSSISNTSPS